MSLIVFNQLPEPAAYSALERCCVSRRWIQGMLARRPFADRVTLKDAADQVWATLDETDFLQAFEGHPRIGDVESLQAKYQASSALAAGEQSGVKQASDELIVRLATGNAEYAEKFGFIFIVCASGKSALQMCEILEARLGNTREQELLNAAEEQRKILQLRLDAVQ